MPNIYSTAANKLDQFMEGALDGKVKSEIRSRALIAGFCMVIPFFGIETIIYAIVLWGTYGKISEISGVPFKDNAVKNIISGFVINIIVTAILGFFVDFIPVVKWIASFAIGYLSLEMSAMGYVKALKVAHGRKSRLDLNTSNGFQSMKAGRISLQATKDFEKAEKITEHTNNAISSFQAGEYGSASESAQQAYNLYTGTDIDNSTEPEEWVEPIDQEILDELPIGQQLKESNTKKEVSRQSQVEDLSNSSHKSKIELLRELKSLLDEGVLTEEEFNTEKKKILSQN